MTLERITFLLAIAGYAGLTATTALGAFGRFPRRAWPIAALAILVHVGLVWGGRYRWQLAEATRNGYAGFLVFHAALGLILGSLFVRERLARIFVGVAFAIVTVGALGAVFRYEVVAPYRVPVILLAITGAGAHLAAYRKRRA